MRAPSKPAAVQRNPPSRDPDAVRAMFNSLAGRYDFANHFLSVGFDLWWRARATRIVAAWEPRKILDLASGSGDLALALQRALPNAAITAADFSSEMLARAQAKGVKETVLADALDLPFPDRAFDCATIAFGLRNMCDWDGALTEMRRVLQPRGRILVLDFSIPAPALRRVYRFYLHRCLPTLAAIVTGRREAYDYLGASIENFPSGGAMLDLIVRNGFASAKAEPCSGGIATIYTAEKIESLTRGSSDGG